MQLPSWDYMSHPLHLHTAMWLVLAKGMWGELMSVTSGPRWLRVLGTFPTLSAGHWKSPVGFEKSLNPCVNTLGRATQNTLDVTQKRLKLYYVKHWDLGIICFSSWHILTNIFPLGEYFSFFYLENWRPSSDIKSWGCFTSRPQSVYTGLSHTWDIAL